MYAIDEAGNFNACFTDVTVQDQAGNCDDDIVPPGMVCINGLSVLLSPPNNEVVIFALDFISSLSDNCDPDPILNLNLLSESTGAPQGETTLLFNETGAYEVEVWAIDESNNTSSCVTTLLVGDPSTGQECDLDETPPVAICNDNPNIEIDPVVGATISATDIDEGSFDFCSPITLSIELGPDPSPTMPTTESITINEMGPHPIIVWVADENGNISQCWTIISVTGVSDPIEGNVFNDANDNCTLDGSESDSGLEGWTIRATNTTTGAVITNETEADGSYVLGAINDGGDCDPSNNEVDFTIKNIGDGPMVSPQTHIIIEDVVMYMTGEDPIELEAGEDATYSFPATGATWRLAIGQDESFPFGGVAAAFVEGCGGFTPGMATPFSLSSSKPNVTDDCQENIGSWAPQ